MISLYESITQKLKAVWRYIHSLYTEEIPSDYEGSDW